MDLKKTYSILLLATLFYTLLLSAFASPVFATPVQFLNPLTIPKWVNQLSGPPPVYAPINITDSNGNVIQQDYEVKVTEFYQQMLPTVDANGNPTGFGPTRVFGFGGEAKDAITGKDLGFVRTAPGPTFEAIRGIPINVKWVNDLVDEEGKPLNQIFPVDPTIHWANPNEIDTMNIITQFSQGLSPPFPPGYNGTQYKLPGTNTVTNPDGWNAQSPVPLVVHLHGGEAPSAYDGTPEQWFTPNGIHGSTYQTAEPTETNAAVYEYPNAQQPTMLWYHDHTLGMTRISNMAGLAGPYMLRDPADSIAPLLPSGEYEMPLVIQDRIFLPNGSLYYPTDGLYPNYDPDYILMPGGSLSLFNGTSLPYEPVSHYTKYNPYMLAPFLGNTIVVNGKVWPNMDVKQGQYRFRILSASNARVYKLSFSNGINFTLIGSDGGYIKAPLSLNSLTISPAERYDILVDFSGVPVGEKIILQNTALIPPIDVPTQKLTLGQIVQFTVTAGEGFAPKSLNSQLNPTLAGSFPNLPAPTKTRILTLPESYLADAITPMNLYIDGQRWAAPVSEVPELGSTEDWVIVNTFDTHPIHLHLVQFQLVYRQKINATAYFKDWVALNGVPPLNHTTINLPSLEPYLIGEPIAPLPQEQCWKDTILSYSFQIMVIRVRFSPQDGTDFPFDATAGPGYVWHCHMLEHEDMEMMRPYMITQASTSTFPVIRIVVTALVIGVPVGIIVFKYVRSRSHKKQGNNINNTR